MGSAQRDELERTLDDLRDLAPDDAQELSAFAEKRRWFEERLKASTWVGIVLESLPPIHPFLHTIETQSPRSSGHAEDIVPPLSLPCMIDVLAEQTKRDELEEEILAFDDGELARIKAKTRAVTLVPLTPPSTRLVALALDLIVLVDRLLTLLRRRHDLLHLTSLHIQWNEARAQVAGETVALSRDLDELISSSGTWRPNESTDRRTSRQFSSAHDIILSSGKIKGASPLPLPVSSQDNAAGMVPINGSPSTKSSYTTSSRLPVTNVKITLLQSRLSSLRTRHANMVTVPLQRTVSLLDQMIDLAAPLTGLGGVDGRNDGTCNGAVPDIFLDMQDTLETNAGDVGERIEWGSQLRNQWIQSVSKPAAVSRVVIDVHRAETVYQQGVEARDIAQATLDEISSGGRAFNESEISRFRAALQQSTQSLEAISLDSIVRPSHSAFPLQGERNAQVIETLQALRNDAAKRVAHCKRAVEAVSAVADAERACIEALLQIRDWQRSADASMIRLQSGYGDITRPELTIEALTDPSSLRWASSALVWAAEALELDPEPQCRSAMLSHMKLIAAVGRARDVLPEECIAIPHLTDLEHDTEMARTTWSEIILLSQANETDARLIPLIANFVAQCAQSHQLQRSTRRILDDTLDKMSEFSHEVDTPAWASQAKSLAEYGRDLRACYDETYALMESDRHSVLRADLTRLNDSAHSVAIRLVHALQQFREQSCVVVDIEREGTMLLERIQGCAQNDEHHGSEKSLVQAEFNEWESALHRRLPLLSMSTDSIEDEQEIGPLSEALAATKLSIPLHSNIEPGLDRLQSRLEAADKRARERVNVIHGEVASALQSLYKRGPKVIKTPEEILMQLQQLNLRHRVGPLEEGSNPFNQVSRDLPHLRQTQDLAAKFDELAQEAQLFPDATELQLEVGTGQRLVSRLLDLGRLSTLISDTDRAISLAVDLIDTNQPAGPSLQAAFQAWNLAESHSDATNLNDDPRVSSELRRLERTLKEIERVLEAGGSSDDDSDDESVMASSVLSRTTRVTNRATSNPLRVQAPSLGPRSRASSESWSQTKLRSARGPSAPRVSSIGNAPSTTLPPVRSETAKRKRYIPNPKSRLDVAVGRVVNKLAVGFAVAPFKGPGAGTTETGSIEWHDQSGKYWIGTEGSARLCFCRILRSKTVMVRVGGGWTELSRFLLDHYAELAQETPAAGCLPDKSAPSTPPRPRPSASSTTSSLSLSTSTSLLSLSPLRYLRKASDSPPIRDKERERFARR